MPFSRRSPLVTQPCDWYAQHDNLEATAMSVDWSGSLVLLAGRRDLALQSLQKNQSGPESLRIFHRNSKYEVSSAEWAICHQSQEYCAIATSQLIEVVTWNSGDPTLIHSLRAHTRVITDIDWHSKEPHLLASCSVDTFTHLWDLRDPKKPILSLSAVCMSGATQVGFNRVSGNLIATAHDGDLRIWDRRKGSCPVQYITAHLARIHGINWSHVQETHLTTASQDGTVKYFDIDHPRRAKAIITTKSPVWRARYAPFTDGLVTIIVPNLERGENSLLLWSNSRQTRPVCSFVGHKDVVLDFAFRPNREANAGDMEIVSWSRDQTLRIWKVNTRLQRMCDRDAGGAFSEDEELLSNSPMQKSFSTGMEVALNSAFRTSTALQHEFSLLNTNIPHIDVQNLDPLERKAQVKITANGHTVMLLVTFPLSYPDSDEPPEFIYCPGTSLEATLASALMKRLKATASEQVRKDRLCLERCLRALVTALKRTSSGSDKGHMRLQSPRLEGALSGALHDACVPFPKTSGARFGHVNLLVTFSCPLSTIRPHNTTPRALSALSGGYLGNVMGTKPILYAQRETNASSFYLPDRKISTRHRRISQRPISTAAVLYDATRVARVSRELATEYRIGGSIGDTCRHNRAVAEMHERPHLVQAWSLAETIADSLDEILHEPSLVPLNMIFAADILESQILFALESFDPQTAAMLCVAFGQHSGKTPDYTPRRSPGPEELESGSLLRPGRQPVFERAKRFYADLLNRWGLTVARAKVVKYLAPWPAAGEGGRDSVVMIDCQKCRTRCRCGGRPQLVCSLCRLPVHGIANMCEKCGHGGHAMHVREWFSKQRVCATGCGCLCLDSAAVEENGGVDGGVEELEEGIEASI